MALLGASFAASSQNVDKEFLKKKKFDWFGFEGCVLVVDTPAKYAYSHVGNVTMTTVGEQVTINMGGEKYSSRSEGKEEFVKEFIYRQNYCSFVR